MSDLGGEDQVWVKTDRLKEPQIRHTSAHGERDHVLPGNKEYEEGDRIKRPQSQGGRGAGGDPAEEGDGEDGFRFALSQEEFLDIFFDDLELPDLLRKQMKSTDSFTKVRAGHAISGTIPNLNLKRTMQNSLARRIALKRPKPAEIDRYRGGAGGARRRRRASVRKRSRRCWRRKSAAAGRSPSSTRWMCATTASNWCRSR